VTSGTQTGTAIVDPQYLQTRILSLGREALEERRELSELLAEAFHELRLARTSLMTLEERLRAREGELEELKRAKAAGVAEPSIAPRPRAPEASHASTAWKQRAPAPDVPSAAPASPTSPAPAEGSQEDSRRHGFEIFRGGLPDTAAELERLLRNGVAASVYVGTTAPGDRLPGIREVARRTGLNHKTVRRAYRRLEQERLIEVRDRSGIYVAAPESTVADPADGTDAWIAGLLAAASDRGITLAQIPALLHERTRRTLRCACVDSARDDRIALGREVRERFGLEPLPLSPSAAELSQQLAEADLIVTTPFHAEQVRRLLAPGRPLVVAGLTPSAGEMLANVAARGPCTLVCLDRSSGERLLHSIAPELAERVTVVQTDDALPRNELGRDATLLTPAAWEMLPPERRAGNLLPVGYLSRETAKVMAGVIVALNR
jgi:DNA-binding transcriptional regulator YhcF (GntR family)